MKELTSLRIGGPADALVVPVSAEEVSKVVRWAHQRDVSLLVMGRGSNLLIHDEGIRGVVMRLGPPMDQWKAEAQGESILLWAQSGLPVRRLMREGLRRGWGGMEFLVGIPGYLGGAITMNAGTQEGCVGDIIEELTWVGPDGEIQIQRRDVLRFSYRNLSVSPGGAIVEAVLRLHKRSSEMIRDALRHRMARRRRNQPLEMPNAGSVFKNPPGDFAGRIIEQLGLKGLACGGAQVSLKHANFIVNRGGAKARDVLELIDEVRNRVLCETGIRLELEIRVVGERS